MRPTLILLILTLAMAAYAGGQSDQISLPRKSTTGLEGWTQAYFRHSKGAWMNGELVVKNLEGSTQTFRAGYAFIVGWDFCGDDSCVVVQSQNAHGPYCWQLFEIPTGALLEEYFRSKTENPPDWVIDFTDNQKAKAEQ